MGVSREDPDLEKDLCKIKYYKWRISGLNVANSGNIDYGSRVMVARDRSLDMANVLGVWVIHVVDRGCRIYVCSNAVRGF